jgi:hypothetical protein
VITGLFLFNRSCRGYGLTCTPAGFNSYLREIISADKLARTRWASNTDGANNLLVSRRQKLFTLAVYAGGVQKPSQSFESGLTTWLCNTWLLLITGTISWHDVSIPSSLIPQNRAGLPEVVLNCEPAIFLNLALPISETEASVRWRAIYRPH